MWWWIAGGLVTTATALVCVAARQLHAASVSRLRAACGPAGSVLVVTAHPDDEAMFFVPFIRSALHAGVRVRLLCLSTGNADGLGRVRTKELLASAAGVLGLTSTDVTCVDDPLLQDGMDTQWPPGAILRHVFAECAADPPAAVVTFDDYGVSGHRNHRAVHAALVHGLRRGSTPLWCLQSVPLWRKYCGVADVTASVCAALLWRRHTQLFVLASPRTSHAAMCAHWSQYVWHRRLFVVLSRYTITNTLHTALT